jgi:F-type H+-transporting ATPase subunit delta
MPGRISRRKLAYYVAEKLTKGDGKKALSELAAFLVETRRTDEVELLVRDIEQELADRGLVVANITTTRPLGDSLKNDIKNLVGGKTLQVRETIDESVLGGVRVDIPGKRFDGTIRRKLTALKAKQV